MQARRFLTPHSATVTAIMIQTAGRRPKAAARSRVIAAPVPVAAWPTPTVSPQASIRPVAPAIAKHEWLSIHQVRDIGAETNNSARWDASSVGIRWAASIL
jgi:hypothetical protein